jgi:acyl-CoA thioester hydrolase
MGAEGVEVWRGGVNPWECDVMGHMNVRFYVAKATEGLVRLAARMGMPRAFVADATATLQVREHHIRFVKEARPAAPLHMTAGVLELGESDAQLLFLLQHSFSGEIAAAIQTHVAHVTPNLCEAFPWPHRIQQLLEGLRIEVPDAVRPRSLQPRGAAPGGDMKTARRIGLASISSGAVQPADCDVFGRLLPEGIMARISDGFSQWSQAGRLLSGGEGASGEPKRRIGAAAVEMRLAYRRMPAAGEMLEMRSGLKAATEKAQTVIHWILDPVSGEPWAAAEHVLVPLDLDARRIAPLPPSMVERLQPLVKPDLTV